VLARARLEDSAQLAVFSRTTLLRDNNSIETEAALNAPTKAPSVIQRRSMGSAWRLGDFEREAQCACAHGSSKRSWQFTVGSFQTEGTEDESAYARSGSHLLADTARQAGVTGIKYQEEHGGESGEHGEIAEVWVFISPLPDPTWYPRHLAHVRRRRERTDQDRREQRERQGE